jgi:S-adenosylmethionine hydrolase
MKMARHRRRLIALLTDFGTQDGFVAVMKGVILSIHPEAAVLDLTHEIPPQDVNAAAYVLWSAHSFFPEGTIFVVVVDPGVGTNRRILCAASKKHLFLAPDNGVLKYLAGDGGLKRIWEVKSRRYFLSPVSRTFHGRDIFAPVAAWLSKGIEPQKLGRRIKSISAKKAFVTVGRRPGRLQGEVIHTDRFGNLITNFRPTEDVLQLERTIVLRLKGNVIGRLSNSYSEGSSRKPVAVLNSSNLIEIGVKNGNASELLKAKTGERVSLEIH